MVRQSTIVSCQCKPAKCAGIQNSEQNVVRQWKYSPGVFSFEVLFDVMDCLSALLRRIDCVLVLMKCSSTTLASCSSQRQLAKFLITKVESGYY